MSFLGLVVYAVAGCVFAAVQRAKAFLGGRLGWIVLIGLWPLGLLFLLGDKIPTAQQKDPEHLIRPWHLCGAFSVEEVEVLETVHDPLAAAPAVPFGHLNPAWRAYRATLPPGARLGRFVSRKRETGWTRTLVGYAVRAGARVCHVYIVADCRA